MERNESHSIGSLALAAAGLVIGGATSAVGQSFTDRVSNHYEDRPDRLAITLIPPIILGIAGWAAIVALNCHFDRQDAQRQADRESQNNLSIAQVAEAPVVELTPQQRVPGFEDIWEAEGRQEPTFVAVEQPGDTPYAIGVNFGNIPNEAVQSNADIPARQSSFSERLSEDRESNAEHGRS